MNDKEICKKCIYYDDFCCQNNKAICVNNSEYSDAEMVDVTMGKVNLRITLEMHAEGENYINPNTEEELKEALEGMLSEVIGDESIKYKATMENLDNGIKVCMMN